MKKIPRVDLETLINRVICDKDMIGKLSEDDPKRENKEKLLRDRIERHRRDIFEYVTSECFIQRWRELGKNYNLGL